MITSKKRFRELKRRIITLTLFMTFIIAGCSKQEEAPVETPAEKTDEIAEEEPQKEKFLPAEYIWSTYEKSDVLIKLDYPYEDGKHELYVPKISEDAKMEYRKDGELICTINDTLPLTIKEVTACDYTFDGIIDLIIVGKGRRNNETFWLYKGRSPESDRGSFWFSADNETRDSVRDEIGDEYSADKIENFLTGGLETGKISSYAEAYKALIRLHELGKTDYTYNLIYLDDDDIPELVEDAGYLNIYSFSDGKVTHPLIDCAYGVGGCVYYEYAPYKSTLRSFGHDMEEYGNTIYSIKDNMLTTLYDEIGFYESTETKYINHTDEALSDEELKDRIDELNSYSYIEIYGEYQKEEILDMLD